jgi:hypothetical protein
LKGDEYLDDEVDVSEDEDKDMDIVFPFGNVIIGLGTPHGVADGDDPEEINNYGNTDNVENFSLMRLLVLPNDVGEEKEGEVVVRSGETT